MIAPSGKFEIKVDGAPLAANHDAMLARIEVDQRVNAPALFELTFRDPRMEVPDVGFSVGQTVAIALHSEAHGGKRALVEGEITTIEQELTSSGGVFTIVRGMARGHRLFRARGTRVFLNQTYSDIITTIAREFGLQPEVEATRAVHPVVTQQGTTHWELVSALAREAGMEVLFDGNRLEVRSPPEAASGGPVLTWGENLKELRSVVTAAGVPTDVGVRGWDPQQKRAVVTTARPAAVGASPGTDPTTFGEALGKADWVATGTAYSEQGNAQDAAKATADELGSTSVELHGIAIGDATMAAGKPITLAEVGKQMSGTYVLTSARHVYAADGAYETEFTVSGRADRSLHGLVSGRGGVPRGSSGAPAVHGVVTAVVTNNKDPDDLARVKVTYPWLSDDCESDWVRMALATAGQGYGAAFLPEVNDEVLVAFDHGDIDRPYIVGALYNGKDRPKYPSYEMVGSSGKVLIRGLDTPTHHRLEFFEQGGSKDAVLLSTGDDKHALTLDQEGMKIVVHSDGKIEIDAGQDITVTTNANMKLDVTGAFEVKARQIKMQAQSGVSIDAGLGVAEMKSSSKASVSGGAMTTVEGAVVRIN